MLGSHGPPLLSFRAAYVQRRLNMMQRSRSYVGLPPGKFVHGITDGVKSVHKMVLDTYIDLPHLPSGVPLTDLGMVKFALQSLHIQEGKLYNLAGFQIRREI